MKQLMNILVVAVVVGLVGSSFAGTYGGGSGTEEYPYQIWTAEQMNDIGADPNDWDKCFVLMDDIDLSIYPPEDPNEQFNLIGNRENPFSGVFEGNNHTIFNFSYSKQQELRYVGLFSYVLGQKAQIRNLRLLKPSVTAENYFCMGALVGWLKQGEMINCFAEDGDIIGDSSAGGLVGVNEGTVKHCFFVGSVVGGNVGGLMGYNRGETVFSYSMGSVSSVGYAGGLVASNKGSIVCCYSSCSVEGSNGVGGLVGSHTIGTIENCFALGDVSGTEWNMGGLVGLIDREGKINRCYSTGSVTGPLNTGGLVGGNSGCTITNSYWDIETSGKEISAGGEGKTTFEMKHQSTFTDWDFINAWNIGENQTYPYLRTVPASDLNKDRVVNLIDLSIMAGQWMEED